MLTTLAADEDQKLLLYIDFVCTEKGVALPWDSIAATMEPRDAAKGEKPMTGEAIKQHLAKLRDHRDAQGHAVPPKLDRGARRAIGGKNTPSTPAPTTRKSSGLGGPPIFPKLASFGRGKAGKAQGAEKETPVKKGSSLVAPVSKSKQLKAEKAMRQALLSSGSLDTPAATSRGGKAVGGLKGATGKRGRRSATAAAAVATEDEDRDDTASSGVVRGRQSRRPERKVYTGMAPDLEELGIKNEPESEDDLPLSKRRNIGQTLGGKKKAAAGLMGDTVQMWQNRIVKSTAGVSAAQSPEVQQSIEQDVGVPDNGSGDSNNQDGDAGFSQATLGDVPNNDFLSGGSHYPEDFRLPQATFANNPTEMNYFEFNPVNYQAQNAIGPLHQPLSVEAANALYPDIGSGYPSPMDLNFMDYQAYGRPDGAPGRLILSGPSNSYTGHVSNDHALTSSPAYDSSATFPGSDPASRNTSTNTSFSNTQGLQDPFTGNYSNGHFGGLPADPMTLGNWCAQPTMTATEAGFGAGHQYPGYTNSQTSSGCVNPTFIAPTSGVGLGISQPHMGGNNLELPMESKVGDAYPYVGQPVPPTFGMAMGSSDLGDPNDPLPGMGEFIDGNCLGPLPGHNFTG
jgi:hypothetical protein